MVKSCRPAGRASGETHKIARESCRLKSSPVLGPRPLPDQALGAAHGSHIGATSEPRGSRQAAAQQSVMGRAVRTAPERIGVVFTAGLLIGSRAQKRWNSARGARSQHLTERGAPDVLWRVQRWTGVSCSPPHATVLFRSKVIAVSWPMRTPPAIRLRAPGRSAVNRARFARLAKRSD